MSNTLERLQKIMSQAGIASRRESEELIKKGRVFVNGKKATIGDKATFNDEIIVNGQPILKEEKVYYMLNKPRKSICTLKDPEGRLKVTDLIDDSRHIFPVGRLDYDTSGIILITNDGELSNKLTHPSFEVKRVYRARLNETLSAGELKFLNSGNVKVNDKFSKQVVEKVDTKSYVITLHVGSYHHVKKLFEEVGKKVLSLTRIEFAGLTHVGMLSSGQYRLLKPKEIKYLKLITQKKGS